MSVKKGARLKLKEYRHSQYMTQKQMAMKIGISNGHYCNIENGTSNPTMKLIERFAEVFNYPNAYDLFKKDQ